MGYRSSSCFRLWASAPGLACGGWCNACSASSLSDSCVARCPRARRAPRGRCRAAGCCPWHILRLPPRGLGKSLDSLGRQLLSSSVSASGAFSLAAWGFARHFFCSFQTEKSELSPDSVWKSMFCNRLFGLTFP